MAAATKMAVSPAVCAHECENLTTIKSTNRFQVVGTYHKSSKRDHIELLVPQERERSGSRRAYGRHQTLGPCISTFKLRHLIPNTQNRKSAPLQNTCSGGRNNPSHGPVRPQRSSCERRQTRRRNHPSARQHSSFRASDRYWMDSCTSNCTFAQP